MKTFTTPYPDLSTHRHHNTRRPRSRTYTLTRHRLQILAIQRLLNHRNRTLQTPSPRRRTRPRHPGTTPCSATTSIEGSCLE